MAVLRAGRVLSLLLCWVVTAALLGGCSAADEGRADARRAVEALLRQRSAAVLERDERAFLATVDPAPAAASYRHEQRTAFRNLADVPLGAWAYRLKGPLSPGAADSADRAEAELELRYRLRGYDSADVRSEERMELVRRDGRWYVGGDGRGSPPQLWEQGAMTVARGDRSIVLGVGQSGHRLHDLAEVADRAVPAVSGAWPGEWRRRVVVLAPESQESMAQLLGAEPGGYQGIAAVTTGEVTRSAGAAPADRVVVNPQAYWLLGPVGRQIVITHETAHVATRAATSAGTPLWLSEGFADWAGYRGLGRTPREGAPELSQALAPRQLPERLPADADFGFGRDGDRLAEAYEQAWLACRLIAEQWGEKRLVAVYRAVGSGEGDVDAALREELGVGIAGFTGQWRAYLHSELG